MIQLLNLPDDLFSPSVFNKLTLYKKIKLFLMSRLYLIIFTYCNGSIYCLLMNKIFINTGKIYYSSDVGYSYKSKDFEIYYPNKLRLNRSIHGIEQLASRFEQKYFLTTLEFKNNDLVIDCGANIGELHYSLPTEVNIIYKAFEPDEKNFKCLDKNLSKKQNVELFKIGLSNKIENRDFYLSQDGSDSSLSYFGSDNKSVIETIKIDALNYKKIKLLKVEAEGYELEVLLGSAKSLKNIEFIAVDVSAERGLNQLNTLPEITNFLFLNNFEINKFNEKFTTLLFKNKGFI